MLDRIKKSVLQVSETLKDQAGAFGDSAKEKTFRLFEQYTAIFPILEQYGLKITSFGISLTLNPAMEVVLNGTREDFTQNRLSELMEKHKGETIINSVFRAMKTTLDLYETSSEEQFETLHVKIVVKIPPEIKVVLGEPSIL